MESPWGTAKNPQGDHDGSTRHIWAKSLGVDQTQEKLASALDEGRRHLVTVHREKDGLLGFEFDPELGDVERAFNEASRGTRGNRPA